MKRVRFTLTEEMLGTKPANPKIFDGFVASKCPDDDLRKQELDSAESREEAGTTIFAKVDGVLGMYDYQIKGFLKEAAGAVNRYDPEFRGDLEKLAAFKTKITQLIHVTPRFIPIVFPEGAPKEVGICQRSIKCETAQGPRVALGKSETVPAGSYVEFDIKILSSELKKYLTVWMSHGEMVGLGQWRSGGKGRFTVTIINE